MYVGLKTTLWKHDSGATYPLWANYSSPNWLYVSLRRQRRQKMFPARLSLGKFQHNWPVCQRDTIGYSSQFHQGGFSNYHLGSCNSLWKTWYTYWIQDGVALLASLPLPLSHSFFLSTASDCSTKWTIMKPFASHSNGQLRNLIIWALMASPMNLGRWTSLNETTCGWSWNKL